MTGCARLTMKRCTPTSSRGSNFSSPLTSANGPGSFIFAPGLLLWLGDLIGRWYTGSNAGVYADLITGVPRQTVTLQENEQLWHLAQMIRRSPVLQALFEAHAGAAFFGAAAACPEAEAFSQAYAAMVREHGHRGQADRDFWFPRRIENPAGDYNAFKAILSADGSVSPAAAEARTRGPARSSRGRGSGKSACTGLRAYSSAGCFDWC